MTLILTQEGIERIWELAEDPYMTDAENEIDMVLRRTSEWGPEGRGSNQWGSHQPHGFPGPRKGPYPFEKNEFINAMINMGWKDRHSLERIVAQLYQEGLIDDLQNVRARKSYPHGKLHSSEHIAHWHGENWRDESPDRAWSGRLSEVSKEKSSPERLAYIKSLYPERFLPDEGIHVQWKQAKSNPAEELEILDLSDFDDEGNIII